jgi:hypothetical protein
MEKEMRYTILALSTLLSITPALSQQAGDVGEGKTCSWNEESHLQEATDGQGCKVIYTFVCQYNSNGKLVWHHVSTARSCGK